MADVSFNGATKIISINNGITSIDTKDLYSWWKEWVLIGNEQFLPAFRSVGGDPTVAGQFISSYFFLLNGWKIKPYEGNHTLNINGNIFSEDGLSPFVNTTGNFNVSILVSTSSQATLVSSTGSTAGGLTSDESTMLRELWKLSGLDSLNPLSVRPNGRTVDTIDQTFTGDETETIVTRN